jgi:hypothetical protein
MITHKAFGMVKNKFTIETKIKIIENVLKYN